MLTIPLMSGDQHVLLTGYGLLGSFPPLKSDLTDPELFLYPLEHFHLKLAVIHFPLRPKR